MDTPLVKLRYQLFNSHALTSAYKAHVFQLQVHHSLSCVLLRQYTCRTCVIDSLGLGKLPVSYITVLCVQGIPVLSPQLFMPSLYSNLKKFNLLVKVKYRELVLHVKKCRDGVTYITSCCMPSFLHSAIPTFILQL